MNTYWQQYAFLCRTSAIQTGACLYRDRNLPKEERKNIRFKVHMPLGHFDNSGIWWPHPLEVCDCCRELKFYTATSKYRYGWLKHCCTIGHIAQSLDIDKKDLTRQLVTDGVLNKRRNMSTSHCAECGRFCASKDYLCRGCRENSQNIPS